MRKTTSSLFVTACLLLPVQAQALDVSVGGISASVGGYDSGGVSASASVGGSGGINAGADLGGRSGRGLGAGVGVNVGVGTGTTGVPGGPISPWLFPNSAMRLYL